jgi:hypothetical protein
VEGNPRLLECLLAAASGSDNWSQVVHGKLDSFFSKGIASERDAVSILDLLMPMVERSGVLQSCALTTTGTAGGSKLLLTLLGRCLLGTLVSSGLISAAPRESYCFRRMLSTLAVVSVALLLLTNSSRSASAQVKHGGEGCHSLLVYCCVFGAR